MGKIFVGVLIGAALVAVILGGYGLVNAQSQVPQFQQGGPGYGMMGGGYGRMGGANGMMGGGYGMMGQGYANGQTGPMHDLMIAAWADKLGLSVDDLNQRLTDGETMYDIAISTGLTAEEFQAASVEIHATVLDEAVAQGLITQEQADWMKSRAGRMGAGGCGGGAGRGRWGNAAPQTNP